VSSAPAEVLEIAVGFSRSPRPGLHRVWPRATALLARQALELAVEEVWEKVSPGSRRISMRARLLCFEEYLEDGLAGEVAYAWAALSDACHFHPYELGPSEVEIVELLTLTEIAMRKLRVQHPA
jgi:hypothetical protein